MAAPEGVLDTIGLLGPMSLRVRVWKGYHLKPLIIPIHTLQQTLSTQPRVPMAQCSYQ